jgi:hypothetical protein
MTLPATSCFNEDESTCCFVLQNQLNLEREGTTGRFTIYVVPRHPSHRVSSRMAKSLSFHTFLLNYESVIF